MKDGIILSGFYNPEITGENEEEDYDGQESHGAGLV